MAGDVGPHRCKNLTDVTEVFLERSLLNGIPLRGQKYGTDALGKNLEEQNGVFNAFEVGGNFQPEVEAPPLAPGGGVFLEDGGREALGYCLLCIIVVSCLGSWLVRSEERV